MAMEGENYVGSETESRIWVKEQVDHEFNVANKSRGLTVGSESLMQGGDEIGETITEGVGDDNDGRAGDKRNSRVKEQTMENRRTRELVVEFGAMLYNEEDDIMAPCYFMGDFNKIVQVEERKSADRFAVTAEEFKNLIQDMHLVDLSLNDRGPRGLSDHYPMIVEDTKIRGDPRPFISLDSWFTHEDFLIMVTEEWRGLGEVGITNKLKALTVTLGRWHKDNFGDMDKKILKFEGEIKKINDMVSSGV
ncbi:uncharacterized protein DS421_9g285860 [Arachis hypogaea]|nr:uncharacterized protein DS421_9g285860 [Arachis hypogaea]